MKRIIPCSFLFIVGLAAMAGPSQAVLSPAVEMPGFAAHPAMPTLGSWSAAVDEND
jgi:hypothetical protein